MRLKLNHLTLITEIARHQQLSLAARALHITQPAASRLLAELEREIDAPVCKRHPRGLELTDFGQVLATRAHSILQELQNTQTELGELKDGLSGSACVGAITGGAIGYLAPAIEQLQQIAPKLKITANVAPSTQLIKGLQSGEFDFVLARSQPWLDPSDYEISPVGVERLQLVTGKDHPLAHAKDIDLLELQRYRWVMQDTGLPVRQTIDQAFIARGAHPPLCAVNTPSLLMMIAMVKQTNFITPMAQEVVDLLISDDTVGGLTTLKLKEQLQVVPYQLISRPSVQLSSAAKRLRDLVKDRLSPELH